MKRIYFDYAASSPMALEVKKTIALTQEKFGNPGSLHFFGQEAMKIVDESREKIAQAINADFREIIFTGSATEANNLALSGVIKAAKKYLGRNKARIIISSVEHESVLATARNLEKDGIGVIYLPVDKNGFVDLQKLKKSLNRNTILVSVMYANNETGSIQPIKEITKIISEFKKNLNKPINQSTNYPIVHVDAVQAFQYLDCDVKDLGVDLMTLSGHKICGPKGIGALYIKNQQLTTNNLQPIILGGGQEFGLRSGTENTALIAGFAKSIELTDKNRKLEIKRMSNIKSYFWKKIKSIFPKAQLNGIISDKFLPNIFSVYFPNFNGYDLLIKLDLVGVAVSTGAACSARSSEPSYVLKACGLSEKRIKSSLRFSFGRYTTKQEIDEAVKRIKLVLSSSLV